MEKTILGRSKIQKNGSFVIPKKAREFLNVDKGDKVALNLENNGELHITKY